LGRGANEEGRWKKEIENKGGEKEKR